MGTFVDREKLLRFLEELSKRAKSAGKIYLTGGASAVLYGWRTSTIDIDLKLDPEPAGIFEAIRDLKEQLHINVELASPDDFLPPVPDWQSRSLLIAHFGNVEFRHYDFVGQALAKLERGHTKDVLDVREMLARNLVTIQALHEGLTAIVPALLRYPSLDEDQLKRKITEALLQFEAEGVA